jgi:hypothetical protein
MWTVMRIVGGKSWGYDTERATAAAAAAAVIRTVE